MALIDFTLSEARRFYSSMGNPLGWKGLMIFAAAQIKSNFYLFADESNLLYADKNLKS